MSIVDLSGNISISFSLAGSFTYKIVMSCGKGVFCGTLHMRKWTWFHTTHSVVGAAQ